MDLEEYLEMAEFIDSTPNFWGLEVSNTPNNTHEDVETTDTIENEGKFIKSRLPAFF